MIGGIYLSENFQGKLELLFHNIELAKRKFVSGVRTFMEDHKEEIKAFLEFSQRVSLELEDDKKIEKYVENKYFWRNLSHISKNHSFHVPQNSSYEVFDYLCEREINYSDLKKLTAEVDVFKVIALLKEEQNNDYMFKNYLLDIMEVYKENPDSYRLYIPALFMIIEGSLAEVLTVTESGTAYEIKRKIYVIEDLFDYIYSNQFIGKNPTFHSKVLITNFKEIFISSTTGSSGGEVRLNRNKVLHGKSDPKDWKVEQFEELVNLIYTVLCAREMINQYTGVFEFFWKDYIDEIENMNFNNYQRFLSKSKKSPRPLSEKERAKKRGIRENTMEKDLMQLLNCDDKTAKIILENSNFHEINNKAKQLI